MVGSKNISSQILTLSLLLLALPMADGQSCDCQQNATCFQQTSFCICPENYIGQNCEVHAPNITDQAVQAEISQEYTYFYFQPSETNYFQVKIDICTEKALQGTFNLLFVDIEGRDGKFSRDPPMNKEANFPSSTGCGSFYTPFLPYLSKQNGRIQRLIFGMKNSGGTIDNPEIVTIECSGNGFLSQAFWLTLIIAFLAVISILTVGSIIFCIKQRYALRQRARSENVQFNLDHFEKSMPSVRYSSLTQQKTEPAQKQKLECSICLAEMEAEEYIRKTPCEHIFHQKCLDKWCVKHISCPVCRASFEKQALEFSLRETTNIRQPMLEVQSH